MSPHARKRFRERCTEGGPWPEFSDNELAAWIASMVIANADVATFWYSPERGRDGESIVVPLWEEDVCLAVAVCERSWYDLYIVAVTTVYPVGEANWAGIEQGELPSWWAEWVRRLQTSAGANEGAA